MNLADTLFIRKLHDSGPPLTEADLTAFEKELGWRLPADYREFLLLRNGGRFYENIVCPLPTEEYSDDLGLGVLFRLLEPSDPDRNVEGLRRNFAMHEGRLPDHTLPICDSGEDMLLIELGPENVGSIWIWVRDFELLRKREENRIIAATSFSELVAGYRLDPYYPESQMEEPFIAVEQFDLDGLTRCLDAGLSPDARNEEDMTLLAFACQERNHDAVALLLSRGADPDLPDLPRGYRPVHFAKFSGARDIVSLLLRHGARPLEETK